MRVSTIAAVAAALALGIAIGYQAIPAEGQARSTGFAAVPGEKGGQDPFGAYDIVANWPKPISSLPGLSNWTWGAGQSVFAETPNRVFILQRGMLPNLPRPRAIKLPQLGAEHRVPDRPAAVARCHRGLAARSARGERQGRRRFRRG